METSEKISTEKRAGKFMKKKKRRKKHYILRILSFIIICIGLYFGLHIDYFAVDGIAVVGNEEISDEEIIKLSKLKTGIKLCDVHPLAVQRKIKKNLYVESVDVDRKLPDKVIIQITERSGKAQFVMGKKYIVTDNEGKVLEIAEKQQQVTLIENVKVTKAKLEKKIKVTDSAAYDKTMDFIKITEQNDLYFKKVDIDKNYIEAYVYDDLVCKGKYDDLLRAIKSQALKTVLYDLYQKGKESGVINIGSNDYCSFTP